MTKDRIILALQLLALTLAFFATPIVTWLLEADRVDVTASADYSDDHAPQYAVDGVASTEWLLPDGAVGYIELSFSSSRKVRAVKLTNGHNPGYWDRSIRKARILVYDDDRVVEQHDVEFPGLEREYKPRRIELSGKRATRVRLQVLEPEGNGAALSEIAIE